MQKYFHIAGLTFIFSWDGVERLDLAPTFNVSHVNEKYLGLTGLGAEIGYANARDFEEIEHWKEIALELGYKEVHV